LRLNIDFLSLSANAVALSAWDPQQLLAPGAELSSNVNSGAQPTLTVYDGAGQNRYPDAAYAQQIAQLRLAALDLPGKTYVGAGAARQLGAGARFSLTQHDHYPDAADANQFKLLWVEHAGANNLSAQVSDLLQRLGSHNKSASSAGTVSTSSYEIDSDMSQLERGTYRNRFCAVRAAVPVVRPASAQPAPRIAPGPQTALVVGLAGEALSTERNHRVKVQFAWQRGTNPNAGGLTDTGVAGAPSAAGNAPNSDASGTWVRVGEALAGPNWGTQFTPRLGTDVLIDFVDADLDQPVIVAQLYNGVDTPPFAAGVDTGDGLGVNASVNHGGTLSGWHSHNLEGANNYNQWVLDDSTAQLRMRLGSSSAASQINTGYLISQNPSSAQRGAYRGSGFELRTDAWGVVRATQGLLISSSAKSQNGASVNSTQMDTQEARAQLKAAQSLTDALHQAAGQQHALGAEQTKASASAQKTLLQNLDPKEQGSFKQQGLANLNGQPTQKAQTGSRELDSAAAVEHFAAPLIVLDAPSSIMLTSAASSALFAGEHLQWVTQGDSHLGAAHTVALVAGKTQSLFTHVGGIEAVAANGPLSLQAHTDELELLADKEVTVISVNDSISLNAKSQIVLKGGQTSITLDGADITFACSGTFSVKGSGQGLGDGASSPASLASLPTGMTSHQDVPAFTEALHTGQYELFKVDNRPFEGYDYEIRSGRTGKVLANGKTDASGYTRIVTTQAAEPISVFKSIMRESERITENWQAKLAKVSRSTRLGA